MDLSDWIGIFAIIFVGFAGMFYGVATRVFETEKTVRKNLTNFRDLGLNKLAGF